MSLSSTTKAATPGSSTDIRSQQKNLPSRETPTASFSTVSNALSVKERRGGDLKKSHIHRKVHLSTTSYNMSTAPPFSIPTVSFDNSIPPSTTCTKRKHSPMESTSDVCDVKKKNAFMGKNAKRKDSPLASSKPSSVGGSLSKKQKASSVAGACSHAAPPPQYPYGHYPHYPYYYPYYPPPANMVAAPPPPTPGYTWPYPVAAPPPGYPVYYPPHYYHHRHPTVVGQPPAAVTSKHRDNHKTSSGTKHKGTVKSSAPTTSSSSTPKGSSHKAVVQPDSVPSSSCQDGSPSCFEPAKFPPRNITIHNLHNDSFDLHQTSSPTETGIDRRERKNAQSRKRAAKLKESIHIIKSKKPEDRTPEEVAKLETYEERRRRKNGRSRERALERKARFEEISAKPEKEWTEEERSFMKETLKAKYRKNEGDRLRRKKMRESGSNVSVASCAFSSSNVLSRSKSSAFVGVASASRSSFKGSHSQGEAVHRGCDVQLGGNDAAVGAAAPLTPKNGTDLNDDDDDGFARIFDLSPRRAAGGEKDSVSHLIFPSPSDDEERLIQSPTLELCAETSILDQNLEDIILSPHFATPRATVSADDDTEEEFRRVMDASFSPSVSPLTLRLLDLPRRSKPEENLYEDAFCTDWRGFGETDDSNHQHEPIAVSFSMDTI